MATKQEHIAVMKCYKAQLDDTFKRLRKAKAKDEKDYFIGCIETLADKLRSESRSAKSESW